jgi:hypothetical protein
MSKRNATLFTIGQTVHYISNGDVFATGTVIGTSGGWSRCYTVRYSDGFVGTHAAATNVLRAA